MEARFGIIEVMNLCHPGEDLYQRSCLLFFSDWVCEGELFILEPVLEWIFLWWGEVGWESMRTQIQGTGAGIIRHSMVSESEPFQNVDQFRTIYNVLPLSKENHCNIIESAIVVYYKSACQINFPFCSIA